jgi:hypothetical protein
MMRKLQSQFLFFFFCFNFLLASETVTRQQLADKILWNVTCLADYSNICPQFLTDSIQQPCARIVMDDVFTKTEIEDLHQIAKKGMVNKTLGGPTILDINTGFVRDSNGVENLFLHENSIFSPTDFEIYGKIIHRLKSVVSSSFGFTVHFTTPTFITRLDGSTPWQPSGESLPRPSLSGLS